MFTPPAVRTPYFIVTHEGSLHGEDTPENRELVRRIHACFNACEGISTDELEQGVVQDMRRVLKEVLPVLQCQVKGDRALEKRSA